MRAVLGLGNPGVQYVDTRHNAGFIILDRFAEKYKFSFRPSKSNYFYVKGELNGSSYFLIKPTSYVNLSGTVALDFIDKHSLSPSELLVIVDDINLDLGKVRIRKSGGSGGHNGLESLIYHLETEEFPRIRFGIGNKFENGEQADYVLSKFTEEEYNIINPKIDFVVELIAQFIEGGTQKMLDYNSKKSQTTNLSSPPKNNEEN